MSRRAVLLAAGLLSLYTLAHAQTFSIPSTGGVPTVTTRKSGWWFAESFGTAMRTVGTPTPVTAGTLAFVSKTTSGYVSYTTTTTLANVARLNLQVTELPFRTKWNPTVEMDVYTDASAITGLMYYFGIWGSNTPPVSATGTNAMYAGFRYVAGTDTQWVAIVNDGTIANQTVSGNLGTIAADTRYLLKVVFSGGGTSAQFYINSVAVGSPMATHLPDVNTDVGIYFQVVNTAGGGGSARAFSQARVYYEFD